MAISSETIDRIKSLPISEILQAEGVAIKPVGREFVCQCVWHDDKNPSLTISDQKGFLFCHVCRQSGDGINYIQERYGLSFREAVERIGANHNIPIIYKDENSEEIAKRLQERENAYKLTDKKQQEFRESLKNSQKAKDFIKSRNIKPETSREFGLGYDKYGNRLTIPIHNSSGKLVGFSRRSMGDDKPKYINTENNVIFNKSDIVFNEYRALESIRESGECIFVEGHIDVIMLHQFGVRNVVALQGTASPDEPIIKRLLRRTSRFVLAMDGDEGGRKAIEKFITATQKYALDGSLDLRIATLPDGMDPDDCINKGLDFRSIIARSVSWMDWILDSWLEKLDFQDSVKFNKVEIQIKELVSKISSSALRAHYYDKAALKLAQNKQNLAAQIAKSFHESNKKRPQSGSWRLPTPLETRRNVEKRLLRLYIHRSSLRGILRPLMDKLYFPEMVWLWHRIQEVETHSEADNFCLFLMAVLLVAEPQYLQQLRPLVTPTIQIDESSGVILHIEDTMLKEIQQDSN